MLFNLYYSNQDELGKDNSFDYVVLTTKLVNFFVKIDINIIQKYLII